MMGDTLCIINELKYIHRSDYNTMKKALDKSFYFSLPQ